MKKKHYIKLSKEQIEELRKQQNILESNASILSVITFDYETKKNSTIQKIQLAKMKYEDLLTTINTEKKQIKFIDLKNGTIHFKEA